MSAGRWIASGPDLTAPSAVVNRLEEAILRASCRARFYGVGEVWEVTDDGALLRRRFVRAHGGAVVEDGDP